MGSDERAVVIGFVGSSGAGKTTLLEHVVAGLEARGLGVGVVKHASHGFVADRPGKDSHRLYGAGARAVALVSREQIALFQRAATQPAEPDPSLDDALAVLPPGLDVVLVEGFAWAPIPRIVLVKGDEAPRREHLRRAAVIRVVRTREPAEGERFVLPAGAGDAVLRDVLRRVLFRAMRRRAVEERRVEAATGLMPVISGESRSLDHGSRCS